MKYLLITFFIAQLGFAQSAFNFLRVDVSPRAGAMAGSFVATVDDPDVIFYNPAGIKDLSGVPVSFTYTKHLLDMNMTALSASYEFKNIGRFGLGIKYANYGDFTEYDEYGNQFGEYGAGDLALLVGYANEISENFNYGVNAKYVYSSIAGYSSTALAGDIGVMYLIPGERLNIGFAVMNVGTQLQSYIASEEELPLDVVFGISKRLLYLPLQFHVDFHRLNRSSEGSITSRLKSFTFGAEFTLSKVLKLRFGYDNEKRSELKVGSFAGLAGFNFGVGFNVKDYTFNYAYSSFGEIGALHRIGVNSTFSF
ncbi:MAG: type IX secretion system protein PorQ [Ignavibacteriaceae bacterium]|nr:type IX secretion system protein PorQ [Ignavibacteriaceae bacterium]